MNPSSYKNYFNQQHKEQTYQLLKYIVDTVFNMFDYSKEKSYKGYQFEQVYFQPEKNMDFIDIYLLFKNGKDDKLDIYEPEDDVMDDKMKIELRELKNLFKGIDSNFVSYTYFMHRKKNPKSNILTNSLNRDEQLQAFLGEEFFIKYEKDKLTSISEIKEHNQTNFKKQKL